VILLIFFCLLVTIFMYLVILGGSINKSNEEIERENKEQEKYLKDYDNKKRRKNKFLYWFQKYVNNIFIVFLNEKGYRFYGSW